MMERLAAPVMCLEVTAAGCGVSVSQLTAGLRDDNERVRIDAICAVWNMGRTPKAAVPALIEATQDENWTVRSFALKAIVRCRRLPSKDAAQVLVNALQDRVKFIRVEAARGLGNTCRDSSVAAGALRKALQDEEPSVRAEAASALCKINPQIDGRAVVPALLEGLRQKHRSSRAGAALALERIGQAKLTDVWPLVEGLDTRDDSRRLSFAVSLARVSKQGIGFGLLRASMSSDDRLRGFPPPEALEDKGAAAKAAAPALKEFLRHPAAYFRFSAASTLVGMGETDLGLSALVDDLDHDAWIVRALAAQTLGDLGSEAAGALNALEEKLHDNDLNVRRAAAEALKKIKACEQATDDQSDAGQTR